LTQVTKAVARGDVEAADVIDATVEGLDESDRDDIQVARQQATYLRKTNDKLWNWLNGRLERLS
jgi:hydroxypyruvate isomerase